MWQRAYAVTQREHNSGRALGRVDDGHIQSEIATQTDLSEFSKTMLARDEQSLEHLAEADLAYLEMVRTKAGLHHQTAGALATSEAEQALADSWQKLIMLRLKSQKLQLRQQAQPMSKEHMERVEVRDRNMPPRGSMRSSPAHTLAMRATPAPTRCIPTWISPLSLPPPRPPIHHRRVRVCV